MSKEIKVLDNWNKDYEAAIDEWGEFLYEADIDTRFVLGDQWSPQNKAYLAQEHREAYVFNEIGRVVKQISGHQRRNRLQSISTPTQSQDQLTSDIITDGLGYVMRKRNGYNVISDAFEHGALVSGINLISLWMDYSKDPVNGDICLDRVPYNSFLIDPSTTKLDLSDCGFITRRIYVSHDTAKAMVPSKASMIDSITPGNDDKYEYMTHSRNKQSKETLLAYDEYWKRGTKKVFLVTNKETGESQTYRGSRAELNRYVKEFPIFNIKPFYEKTMELNIIIEGQLVYSDKDPNGLNDFPFVPVVGYFTPEYYDYKYRLQGIARKLRDSQEELNKMRSKASDIIKSQVNSGWEIEGGQVENEADLYKTGQGVVIKREAGTPPLIRLQAPELSQAFPLMISDLQKNVVELAGGSQELFGVAEGGNAQISGTLAKQRAGNALTAFNSLFDNLSLSQKLLSEKIVKMIVLNYKPEKIEKITDQKLPRQMVVDEETGEQKEEIIPIDIEEVIQYDISIQEGLESDSQRQIAFMQAIEARNMGVPIPDSFLIKMLPIPNKTELEEAYEEEAKQLQAQAAKQEEIETLQKRLMNAETIHKLSIAEEDRKQATANSARAFASLAAAGDDIAKTKLNNLKVYQELQGLKQSQLMEAMSFIQNLGAEDKQQNTDMLRTQQDRSFEEMKVTDIQPQELTKEAPMMEQ